MYGPKTQNPSIPEPHKPGFDNISPVPTGGISSPFHLRVLAAVCLIFSLVLLALVRFFFLGKAVYGLFDFFGRRPVVAFFLLVLSSSLYVGWIQTEI